MAKSLFLAAFLFLLLPFAHSSLDFGLSASTSEAFEAQAVDFNLKLENFPESVLDFVWSFGDGTEISTESPFASHAYYLEAIDFSPKTFQVKAQIKLKDNGMLLGEKTVPVRITRTEFKAFLPPSSEARQDIAIETGVEKKIRIAFLDKDNSYIQRFLGSSEKEAFSHFSALIKGKSIALQWDSKNLFLEGSFVPDASFEEFEKLELKAALAGSKEKTFFIPLFFKPATIQVRNPFNEEQKYFFGSPVGKISFSLHQKETVVNSGDFEAWLLSKEKILERKKLSFAGGAWSAEFTRPVSEKDSELKITVSGKNASGTKTEKNSFSLEMLSPEGASPTENQVLFVFPMEGRTESRGGATKIEVQVEGQQVASNEVEALLYIDEKQHSITLSCTEKGFCSASLPFALQGTHTIEIVLKPPFSGKAKISTEIIEPIDWGKIIVFGGGITALILSISAFFWRKKLKQLEKRSIERRLEKISELEKKAKLDFFKRRLSESAYRERLLKLQQERELLLKKSTQEKKGKK
ncbi:MAG: hypothetical protein QXK06_00370 [Candidatus Diapherotrites archaeon]